MSSVAETEQGQPRKMGVMHNIRRLFDNLGVVRLIATLAFVVLAIFIARNSWDIPLVEDAERALYDLRAVNSAPLVDQDERIVMVVYTDQTLRDTGQRSPVDRTILANALTNLDAMGANGIGIDILFDQPQDDDPLLKTALSSMQTPTYPAFADAESTEEAIVFEQQEFLTTFLASVTTDKTKPTSIRLETDADGVARRWPAQPKGLPPLLANSLSPLNPEFRNYDRSIRFRLPASSDRPVFNKLPIDLFADAESAEFLKDQISGKYVLIGGDFVDFDQFDTPLTRAALGKSNMIGLEVHAHILAQLLDGYMPASIAPWALWAAAILVVLVGSLTAFSNQKPLAMALVYLGQFAFLMVIPFILQNANVDTLELPVFGWALGWLIGFASVGSAARTIGSKQRAFAQSALGKYLPASIAGEILRDPERLALHGEKREIFAVFTDLEGFTKLSHAVEPEMVAMLLNDYLDRLSAVVLEHGGTLDKFVGDAVVAFWGAPISYSDDGERAAKAAYAMYEAGEAFRNNAPEGVPPIGRTRVGMHYGEAIVGNFGGEGRIQYTAFGDCMNTAARLEAANKTLETKVLVSKEAVERTGLDWFRPMGRITLRGRSTPVEIFEPVPEWRTEQRKAFSDIIAAHDAGDEDAVQKLTAAITNTGKDNALTNLIKRLRQTPKGESYALG